MKEKYIFSVLAFLFVLVILTGCTFSDESTDGNNNTNPSTIQSFTNYFSPSVQTVYNDVATTVPDHNGIAQSFSALVERQIDVFVQDVLFRLVAVYGKHASSSWLNESINYTNYYEYAFMINDNVFTDDLYSLNNNYAMVSLHNVISKPNTYSGTTPIYNLQGGGTANDNDYYNATYYLNDLATYAYGFRGGSWVNNVLGQITTNFFNTIGGVNDANLEWNWNYAEPGITLSDSQENTFIKFYNHYSNTFKTAVANLLATGNSSGLPYSTAINRITHLGFNATDKDKLQNYVLNTIIGNYNLIQDRDYKPSFNILTVNNVSSLTNNNKKYKAYDIIIPALLAQAFNNTFYNTDTSLYITRENNLDTKNSTLTYSNIGTRNFVSVKIVPIKEISLTRLELTVLGSSITRNDLNNIKYSVYKDGTMLADNLSTSVNSSNVITLSFSGYNTQTISSTGYIIINFNIDASKTFNLTFDGYYS